MTGDELRLEMKRETPEALSGRADFGIAGNRFTLGWLKATLDYALANPGVDVVTSVSRNDGSTLTIRFERDDVRL